jgi:hypothetical protein
VVEFLADHGADVNAMSKEGVTPLGLLAKRRVNDRQPVSAATVTASVVAEEPAADRIAEFLRKRGAN